MFWGFGGRGACSKCTLRHWEGMCSQRCSSPQHSTNLYICWSSRDIRACFTSSSQVMWISHLNKSNKDVYCIEILYKYDHTIYSMIYSHPTEFRHAHSINWQQSQCALFCTVSNIIWKSKSIEQYQVLYTIYILLLCNHYLCQQVLIVIYLSVYMLTFSCQQFILLWTIIQSHKTFF